MKFYLIQRKGNIGYDEYNSWVVIARKPKEAFSLCDWGDGHPTRKDVTITELKTGKKAKAILGSFNAG